VGTILAPARARSRPRSGLNKNPAERIFDGAWGWPQQAIFIIFADGKNDENLFL